ncbi:hypothetical protein SMICM17S_11132 [Streptomyces microflavus]
MPGGIQTPCPGTRRRTVFRVCRVVEPTCGQTRSASSWVCTPLVDDPAGTGLSRTAVVSRYGVSTTGPPTDGSDQRSRAVESISPRPRPGAITETDMQVRLA